MHEVVWKLTSTFRLVSPSKSKHLIHTHQSIKEEEKGYFPNQLHSSSVFSTGAAGALAPAILGQSITVTSLYHPQFWNNLHITVNTRNSKVLNKYSPD